MIFDNTHVVFYTTYVMAIIASTACSGRYTFFKLVKGVDGQFTYVLIIL